ncbi:uncharacterized protein LOC111254329 [Varroa destructor]|uniref:Glutaminyl-peptide cyclotransferase n=1 Tax=Varroa destructor TaxID=109461 RepID=A0A7M7KUD2_VARDE|nr:uncharacterized protein LOC111254329 [Varroa destructor]
MRTIESGVRLFLLLVLVGPFSADGLSWHDIRSHGRVSLAVTTAVTALGAYYLTSRPNIFVLQGNQDQTVEPQPTAVEQQADNEDPNVSDITSSRISCRLRPCLSLTIRRWPRRPSALSDDSLARIAARMVAPEIQGDFNRTLDNVCVERQPGTPSHSKVRQFIVSELRALKWKVTEYPFSDMTPHGRKPFTNVVATLDTVACHRLVLACHYDSKVMKNFVAAVDSAVPCSQIINIVKALDPELKLHRDRKTGLTLQLIFFDGEEAYEQWSSTDSLYGSRQLSHQMHQTRFLYAAKNRCEPAARRNIVSELDRIEVFVLLDLLGGKNPSFHSFFADTKELFDQMTDIEQRLNNLGLMEGGRTKYFTGKSTFGAIEDDHIPFMRKDVPIVHIIPHPFPRVWHKSSDNKKNLDWPTIWNLNKIFAAFLAWYMDKIQNELVLISGFRSVVAYKPSAPIVNKAFRVAVASARNDFRSVLQERIFHALSLNRNRSVTIMSRFLQCTTSASATIPLEQMSDASKSRTLSRAGEAFAGGFSCKKSASEQGTVVYCCQSCTFRSVRETSIRAHIIAIHASGGSYSLERLRLIPRLNIARATIKCTSNVRLVETEAQALTPPCPSALDERHQFVDSCFTAKKVVSGTCPVVQNGRASKAGRLHECYFCSFTTCRLEEMEIHSELHSQEVTACPAPSSCQPVTNATSSTLQKWTCAMCRSSFSCPLTLAIHDRACPKSSACTVTAAVTETEQTPLRCSECSFATNVRQLLDFHVYLLHSMHSCGACGQLFASKRLLSTHLNAKHGHACLRCNLSFSNREKLEVHEDSVHLIELTCSTCGLRLPSEPALEEHESRHAAKLCTRCNKMFDSATELQTHLAQIHPRNNLLGCNSCEACFHAFCTPAALATHQAKCLAAAGTCSFCGATCGSADLLLDHVSTTHLEAVIFECPLCPFRTIDPTVHMTHQLVHVALPPPALLSSSRGYQCGICGRWTASTSSLRTHVNNHHRLKPYRCEFCEFHTSSSGNLRAHRAVRHLNTELSVKCNVCNRRYRTVAQMHKHVKKTHEQKLNYECEFCENRFVTELRLKRHLAIVHFEDAEAVTGTEPYAGITRFRCNECEYSSYSTNRFRLHRATHRERLKCPYCDLSFPLVDVLNRHINVRHLKKHVSCSMCGRRLPNESRLAHHVESCHSGNVEPFTCTTCGYFFESLAHLEYHRRTHLTARNFECPTCRRSFTTAASLCVHRLRHSKAESRPRKPYWLFYCDQCKLRFKYKSNLVAHQASVHSPATNQPSAEKFFTCDYCHETAFRSKLLLSYHIRRKHLEQQSFACEHCGKKFHSQNSRDNHVVSVHTKAYKIFCPLCDKGMLSSFRLRLHVLHAHKDGPKRKRARRIQRSMVENNTTIKCLENQHEQLQRQPITDTDGNGLLTQETLTTSVDVDHDNIDVQETTRSGEAVRGVAEAEKASVVSAKIVASVEDTVVTETIESVVEISDDPTTDLISQIILQGSTEID